MSRVLCLLIGLFVSGSPYAETPDYARVTLVLAHFEMLQAALNQRQADEGSYPDELASLAAEGYLRRVPKDPWGTPYLYRIENGHPQIKSLGQDGLIGGEGLNFDFSTSTPGKNRDHLALARRFYDYRQIPEVLFALFAGVIMAIIGVLTVGIVRTYFQSRARR